MTAQFAAPDGRQLAYRDSGGDGPPVLCLAGLTRNGRDFDTVAAHLADRYRVIRLDSRGRGKSDHAEDPLAEYTVPVESGDALALLDHLGIAKTTIIGTSRGGILAMALGSGARDRVKAIVLNDVGAVIEMRGLLRIMATLGRQPKGDTFEQAAADLMQSNAREFPDVPLDRWVTHARAIYKDKGGRPRRSYDKKLRNAAAIAIDSEVATINLWPMFEALHDLPILLFRGQNSDILSRETAAKMVESHPALTLIEIANRGHCPFLDEPEAVAALDRFLEDHA
ncbi:MAG: alpha/beta fold hydrolase [Pikeienuella sp.]